MRSSSLLPSRLQQPHQQQSRPLWALPARRALVLPVRAKLAKPTSVKGTSTVGARKQQLAKQLAQQEQQQKKTLAVSRTTRGLGRTTSSSGSSNSEQAGTGPSSRRGSRFYFNFTGFPFPLGPFFERKTVRTEVRRCVWQNTRRCCSVPRVWNAQALSLSCHPAAACLLSHEPKPVLASRMWSCRESGSLMPLSRSTPVPHQTLHPTQPPPPPGPSHATLSRLLPVPTLSRLLRCLSFQPSSSTSVCG